MWWMTMRCDDAPEDSGLTCTSGGQCAGVALNLMTWWKCDDVDDNVMTWWML